MVNPACDALESAGHELPAAFFTVHVSALRRALLFIIVLMMLAPPLHAARERVPTPKTGDRNGASYASRDDVSRFITEMVERHGFVREELQALFRKSVYQPGIIKAITPLPPRDGTQGRSWQTYRANFVNPQRIEAGQRFRAQYAAALARASAEFGVPEEIILAIIGVETIYGRNMGSYRVVDALVTLGFDYPPRSEYFRSELENYLLHARDTGIDVFSVKGSYAGAIGIPQFMPGSLRRFALDYDGDGQANLVASPVDAIGSVANFLKDHGWERGGAIAVAVRVEGEAFRKFVDGSVKPANRIADLVAAGVSLAEEVSGVVPETLCALVELETPGRPSEYRASLNNFYVITRYNRSSSYAAAVMDLAQALRVTVP